MEPDLKQHLQGIQEEIGEVSDKLGGNFWAFFRGLIGGFGSVIGAFLALLIIGWVLNIIGIIPALKNKVEQWQGTLSNAQQTQLPQVKE
jgi:branched-subunit amino acid ABC-type transport system permease component